MYLLFSLSRIFIYMCLGILVFLLGQAVIEYKFASAAKYFFISGGLFITVIGVLVAFGKDTKHLFCKKFQEFFLNKDSKTVLIFGLIVGILPCAPLISVLSYIGLVAKHWVDALLYSLFFGLGTFVSPLLILVIFSSAVTKAVMYKNNYSRIFNFVFGIIIIYLGVQLILRSF